MNKIFKTKWNAVTQTYTACSELTKRAGKTAAVGMVMCSSFIALPVFAEDINYPETTGEQIAKDFTNQSQTIDGLNITMTPKAGVSARPKGVIVRGQADTTISNLKSNIQLASLDTRVGQMADSNASYGVAVGYDWLGGNSTDTAKLILNNATIDVSNTQDTVYGIYSRVLSNVGHQLSGIRIYRKNGATPELISNGNLNITVTDNSLAKAGDYLTGIYISGNGSSATLNGTTTIKLVSESSGINSAGIKIGKPLDSGVNTGVAGTSVTSHGQIIIDTTQSKNTAGVRLFDNNSAFVITGDKTDATSEIKASSSAIVFDTQDYVIGEDQETDPSRNANGKDQVVKLTDTKLSTTSENATLVRARAQNANSFMVSMAPIFGVNLSGRLNNGSFTTSGAFTLSGEKSLATAAKNGWLFEADDGSTLNATINKNAKAIGLVSKNSSGTLDITIDDATWQLAPKEDGTTTGTLSTLNSLTLNSNGILDASKTTDTAQNAALYNVKLTSDGTASDGTLTNNGGIITLANDSYNDVLTVDGNYSGTNGTIKLNTEWHSPGDDVNGIDSKSDLVIITGNASGNTLVKAIKSDGTENVIDGSIGSIAADLNKNSTVIIRVLGTDNGTDITKTADGTYTYRSTFSGEAKTTGAGVLKLASRTQGTGTEYFWTLTSLNNNTINLDPVVPGYVLAAKTGLELGYTTLATLHERRSENQTLAWDDCGKCGEKAQSQTWGRLFGKQLNLDGENRLNTKQSIYGFQFGHDVAINRTAEGGHRLTGLFAGYAYSNSTFSDRFLTDINGKLAADNTTGKGKQQSWHLGLSHTRYAPNGAYVDLVGQIGLLETKFNSKDNIKAKQKGTTFALSVEVGRPYALGKHKANEGAWLIEPQAQLIYQGLKLGSFNDGTKQVAANTHHGLRGRIGVRLAYNTKSNNLRTKTFYMIANVLQDFSDSKGVRIGQDTIREDYAKTWAEVGLGSQLPIGKASNIYADVRYERNLGGAKRDSYRGNVGFKYTW